MYIRLLAAISMVFISSLSVAGSFYAEISVGQATHPDLSVNTTLETRSNDTSDSLSLGLGYIFNRYLSMSITYNDIGEYSFDNQVIVEPGSAFSIDLYQYDMTGMLLAATATKSLGESFGIFLDIGYQRLKVDGKTLISAAYDSTGVISAEYDEFNNTKGNKVLGAGISYKISKDVFTKFRISNYGNVKSFHNFGTADGSLKNYSLVDSAAALGMCDGTSKSTLAPSISPRLFVPRHVLRPLPCIT